MSITLHCFVGGKHSHEQGRAIRADSYIATTGKSVSLVKYRIDFLTFNIFLLLCPNKYISGTSLYSCTSLTVIMRERNTLLESPHTW